jgi:hypothetical protein
MGEDEQIGAFALRPLDTRMGGWAMSYDQVWLPVILEDRDACLIIVGLVLAGTDDGMLETMQRRVNAIAPGKSVTTAVILEAMEGET